MWILFSKFVFTHHPIRYRTRRQFSASSVCIAKVSGEKRLGQEGSEWKRAKGRRCLLKKEIMGVF